LPRKIKRKKSKSPGARVGDGLLQQVQRAQDEMLKAQEELAAMTVTATAGGGAVTAVVTGEKRVQSLTIAPEVVDPADVDMLQDLVTAAVNEGLEQIDRVTAERMEALTGGLPISDLL
jgi:DNA-binding YbaB/EbfC family protein